MANLKTKELLQIKEALGRKMKDSLINKIDSKSAKIKEIDQTEKSDRNSISNDRNAKIIQKLKMFFLFTKNKIKSMN